MINRILLLLTAMTAVASCANEVRPAFEKMEDAELDLYNASSSLDEQIICREIIDGWRIFSGAVSFREEIKNSESIPGGRQQFQWARYNQQPKFCLSVSQLVSPCQSLSHFVHPSVSQPPNSRPVSHGLVSVSVS